MSQEITAVLTGAAGTIGVATARRLIDGGARVYGIDIDAKALELVAASLGERFVPVQADLGSEDSIALCCEDILGNGGAVEILVNNVGILTTDKFLQTSLEDLRRTMALNFESAFLMSQKLVPGMIDAGRGRIVNVSSFAGRSGGLLAGTAYSLSKAAMIGLTFSLARV